MSLLYKIYLFPFIIFSVTVSGQTSNWKIYQTNNSTIPSNNITAITQDNSGDYWIGFGNDNLGNQGGLFKYDGNNWIKYVIDSLDFGSFQITDIKSDELNNIYVATFGRGVIKINENGYSIFDTLESDISSNDILCIATESRNKIWFGTYWHGLIKYENDVWYNYTTQNSGLTFDEINNIAIDKLGAKWIGTDGLGIVKFDDSTWTTFQCQNFLGIVPVFGLAISNDNDVWITTGGNSNRIGYIRNGECFSFNESDIEFNFSPTYPVGLGIDTSNTIWIGTNAGLVKYDGVNWMLFNENNSPLPGDAWIHNIFIDNYNNVWFAFGDILENSNGLACYNENGITDIQNYNGFIPYKNELLQNYPNPFNPTTTIKYTIPSVIASERSERSNLSNSPQNLQIATNLTASNSRNDANVRLIVYNILGEEIATLVNAKLPPGEYSVQFNASNLPSGVYFYTLRAGDFVVTKKMVLLK